PRRRQGLHHLVQRLLRTGALHALPLHPHRGREAGVLHVEEQRPAVVLRHEEPGRALLGGRRPRRGDEAVSTTKTESPCRQGGGRLLRTVLLLLAVGASPVGAASGPALDYTLECAGCHRADGAGTPGSVPALRDSVARFLAVPGGREYLARV